MSIELEKSGYTVRSSDLIDRGYGEPGINFLSDSMQPFDGDIITNPPYSYATEFIVKALQLIPEGGKVAMFLKIQFLETKGRKDLFLTHPPKTVYVSSSRILCAKNGDFVSAKKDGSAVCYCWYIWEKGYKGDTILKWFN